MERDIVKYWEGSNRMDSLDVKDSFDFPETTKAREAYLSAVKACCYAHEALRNAVTACREEARNKYYSLKKQVKYHPSIEVLLDGRFRLHLKRTYMPEGFIPGKDCPEVISDTYAYIIVGNTLYVAGSFGGYCLVTSNDKPLFITTEQVESIKNGIFPTELIRLESFGLALGVSPK